MNGTKPARKPTCESRGSISIDIVRLDAVQLMSESELEWRGLRMDKQEEERKNDRSPAAMTIECARSL